MPEEKRGRGKPVTHPPVLCVETDKVYKTYKAAAEAIGGSRHGVRRNCEGTQQHHHSLHFEWLKPPQDKH